MMTSENTKKEVSIKDLLSSFRFWPRIFSLLQETSKTYFWLMLILNVCSGLTPILTLYTTQTLINSVMKVEGTDFNRVLIFFIIFLAASLLGEIINNLKGYLEGLFQIAFSYKINVKLMKKAATLRLADFENPVIYDMLQRAQAEASYRPYQVIQSIFQLISGVITLVSAAVVLVVWKWWVAFLLAFIPITSAIYFLKLGQRDFIIHWKRASRLRKLWYFSFLMTRENTYKEVKLYQLGGYLLKKYEHIYSRNFKVDKKLLQLKTIGAFVFQVLNQFFGDLIVLVILYSTYSKEILVGNLVGYIKAVALTEQHSQMVISILCNMYQNNLYVKQLFDFMDVTEDINILIEGNKYYSLPEINEIEFCNISFRYPGADKYALKNISFKIKKGEIFAVVGKNGSGKTTMVKLLTRLYEPENGQIFINGRLIESYNPDDIRGRIGVVFQDFIRYELRVRENVGFGSLDMLYDDEKIHSAVNNAGIGDTVKKFPRGLETQLGSMFDETQQLSGGQWQKIAIARAFIRDCSVYILDEPSASLDPIAESEIFKKFFEVAAGRIGIFTSHRFSTVKYATSILVFKDGELLEQGSHYELMNLKSYYASLYNIQASPYMEKAEEE